MKYFDFIEIFHAIECHEILLYYSELQKIPSRVCKEVQSCGMSSAREIYSALVTCCKDSLIKQCLDV